MFAEVAFDVKPARGRCLQIGIRSIDTVDQLLEFGDVARGGVVQVQVIDFLHRIEHVAPVDDLASALNPNVELLTHRHPGRVPVGGQGVGRRGDTGAAHADLAGSDRNEFHRFRSERTKKQDQQREDAN